MISLRKLTNEEMRFILIYAFIIIFGLLSFHLIHQIVFSVVPKENQQSANMALGFFMGVFTTLSAFLVGASPDKKKDSPISDKPQVVNNNAPVAQQDISTT